MDNPSPQNLTYISHECNTETKWDTNFCSAFFQLATVIQAVHASKEIQAHWWVSWIIE